jgi:hypothetical protein
MNSENKPDVGLWINEILFRHIHTARPIISIKIRAAVLKSVNGTRRVPRRNICKVRTPAPRGKEKAMRSPKRVSLSFLSITAIAKNPRIVGNNMAMHVNIIMVF